MNNGPIKLFFIPFSGGNKNSYNIFKAFLPSHFELIGLELPGRGSRSQESLMFDVEEMADDLLMQVENEINGKYIIFGHSLGAILGLLLCRKLQHKRLNPPSLLFLSGHKSASLCKPDFDFDLSEEELIDKVKEMGGTPIELLQNEEFIDYFLPIIRADFEAINQYSYSSASMLKVPIIVLYGSDEDIVENELLDWKNETEGSFSVHEFDGNHFFIFTNTKEVCKLIAQKNSQIMML